VRYRRQILNRRLFARFNHDDFEVVLHDGFLGTAAAQLELLFLHFELAAPARSAIAQTALAAV
jgi:hypothetical protein